MKQKSSLTASVALFAILFFSCNSNDKKKETEMKEIKLKEQTVSYKVDSAAMSSYLVYDENKEGPRPVVFVIHEWWGLNDYAKNRAKQLAEMGYIAMAVDMYGDGKMGPDPASAEKLAVPFYMKPELASPVFDAAWNALKNFNQADLSKAAAIGYCFGGAQVINLAKMGKDLKGVVSFHGNLNVVPANKDLLKAEILVCHGAADPFVPQAEADEFKKQMDAIGAKYIFKAYEGAQHAFTNPAATDIGIKFKLPVSYNAAADTTSWNEMKQFFAGLFK